MTMTLSYGGEVFADINDIDLPQQKGALADAASDAWDSFQAIAQGSMNFTCNFSGTPTTFDEIKTQIDRLNKSQKPKITERQLWKLQNRQRRGKL